MGPLTLLNEAHIAVHRARIAEDFAHARRTPARRRDVPAAGRPGHWSVFRAARTWAHHEAH